MGTCPEGVKVFAYMHIWEILNVSSSIAQFEKRLVDEVYNGKKYKACPDIDGVVKDFFLANGIDVEIIRGEEGFLFRKKIVNEEENIYINFILKNLQNPKRFLKRAPKKSNLFYYDAEQIEKIISYIEVSKCPKEVRQDIIKSSLRGILELDRQDAIFFVNEKLFVRYFIQKTQKACEKRFNGIPEDEMERLIEKFKDVNFENIIENIAENIISKYLSPKTTDNVTFHQKLIPYFQKSISGVLKKHIPEPELLLGFTNYVFRLNFNVGFNYIASAIIELVHTKDEQVRKFISFYDGSEFKNGDKKVKKTEILVNGERWTFPVIYNLVAQKMNMEGQFFSKEEEIKELKKSLDAHIGDVDRVGLELEASKKELESLKESADEIFKELSALRKEFQQLGVEVNSGKKEQSELDGVKRRIGEMTKDEEMIVKERSSVEKKIDALIVKKVDLEKSIEGGNRKIEVEMEKTVAIKEDYLKIKKRTDELTKALAAALMRFKI